MAPGSLARSKAIKVSNAAVQTVWREAREYKCGWIYGVAFIIQRGQVCGASKQDAGFERAWSGTPAESFRQEYRSSLSFKQGYPAARVTSERAAGLATICYVQLPQRAEAAARRPNSGFRACIAEGAHCRVIP